MNRLGKVRNQVSDPTMLTQIIIKDQTVVEPDAISSTPVRPRG